MLACCHGRCRAPEATSVRERERENFVVVMLEKIEEETTKRRKKEKKNLCLACFCFNRWIVYLSRVAHLNKNERELDTFK